MRLIALLAAACTPKTPPAPADDDRSEVAEDEPSDGPIAGPRDVVQRDTPMPVPSADTPGWGPLPPYVARVRAALDAELTRCLTSGAPISAARPTVVQVTLGPAGDLRAVAVATTSGSEAQDACVLRAFRSATVPPPPPEVLGDGGVLTAEMAFR